MGAVNHIQGRKSCPFLPHVDTVIRPSDISPIRKSGGVNAFLAALQCAQSLWLQGLPAQAILQLNHAMSHHLPEDALPLPMPYQALIWILTHRYEQDFLGNPVRHFQHLATRMSGTNKNIRSARAWACFHLSENVLPEKEFPRDTKQINKEQIVIPVLENVLQSIPSKQERHIIHQLCS